MITAQDPGRQPLQPRMGCPDKNTLQFLFPDGDIPDKALIWPSLPSVRRSSLARRTAGQQRLHPSSQGWGFGHPEVPWCVPGTVAVPGCSSREAEGASPAQPSPEMPPRGINRGKGKNALGSPGLPPNISLPGFCLSQTPKTPFPALSWLPSSRRGQQIAPLEGRESRSGEHEVSIRGCFAVCCGNLQSESFSVALEGWLQPKCLDLLPPDPPKIGPFEGCDADDAQGLGPRHQSLA